MNLKNIPVFVGLFLVQILPSIQAILNFVICLPHPPSTAIRGVYHLLQRTPVSAIVLLAASLPHLL